MESLTQAAFDGVGRYQAEGPQRAFEGLSWAHGKGSGAQACLATICYPYYICYIRFSYITFLGISYTYSVLSVSVRGLPLSTSAKISPLPPLVHVCTIWEDPPSLRTSKFGLNTPLPGCMISVSTSLFSEV